MDTQATLAERIIHLGEVIARSGVGACNVDLLMVAHDARDAGVEPTLIDVMIDEDAPGVVRDRAFALVGSRLVSLSARRSPAIAGVELSSRVLAAH